MISVSGTLASVSVAPQSGNKMDHSPRFFGLRMLTVRGLGSLALWLADLGRGSRGNALTSGHVVVYERTSCGCPFTMVALRMIGESHRFDLEGA